MTFVHALALRLRLYGSIGRLLKSSGLRTTSIKIDPYLNVDAGTMSPFEHGECFVLDDGGETDLDLVRKSSHLAATNPTSNGRLGLVCFALLNH